MVKFTGEPLTSGCSCLTSGPQPTFEDLFNQKTDKLYRYKLAAEQEPDMYSQDDAYRQFGIVYKSWLESWEKFVENHVCKKTQKEKAVNQDKLVKILESQIEFLVNRIEELERQQLATQLETIAREYRDSDPITFDLDPLPKNSEYITALDNAIILSRRILQNGDATEDALRDVVADLMVAAINYSGYNSRCS